MAIQFGSGCSRARSGKLVSWSADESTKFGSICMQSKHNAHLSGLFSDSALASLIDAYPRERIQAFTMGGNAEHPEELVPVDTAGISGHDTLAAIRKGRIWFKLQRIDKWKEYGELVAQLYA